MTDKKAIEYAEALIDFCKTQRGCQNCVFRLFRGEAWGCNINAHYYDAREVRGNYGGKKKHGGYID